MPEAYGKLRDEARRVVSETIVASTPMRPLPYQIALRNHFKQEEAQLWAWLNSGEVNQEYTDAVRLDLLKSTYRLDRDDFRNLYDRTTDTARRLDVHAPVTLYQSQDVGGSSAALCFLPDEIHIVLIGRIRELLTADELQAIIAHELTHHLLWTIDSGDFMMVDRILNVIVNDERAENSYAESARLYQLYSEIYADRGSLQAVGEPEIAVSALLKTVTGTPDIGPRAYLKQAAEIFSQEKVETAELTHPEVYIRARALALWSAAGNETDDGIAVRRQDENDINLQIAAMIEGREELAGLDLLGQQRVTAWTEDLIRHLLSIRVLQTRPMIHHAKLFFPEFELMPPQHFTLDTLKTEIAQTDEKLQEYFAYLLLDFVTADDELDAVALAAVQKTAATLGLLDQFQAIARKELKTRKRDLAKNFEDAEDILGKAEAQLPKEDAQ